MNFRQPLQPGRDVIRHLVRPRGPTPDLALVAVQESGQAEQNGAKRHPVTLETGT